jgi:hypothetical protein
VCALPVYRGCWATLSRNCWAHVYSKSLHLFLAQIEFYFSDSNLPKDKFLRQQVEAHPEGCKWLSCADGLTSWDVQLSGAAVTLFYPILRGCSLRGCRCSCCWCWCH